MGYLMQGGEMCYPQSISDGSASKEEEERIYKSLNAGIDVNEEYAKEGGENMVYATIDELIELDKDGT